MNYSIEQYNKWRGNVVEVFPVCLPELAPDSSEDEYEHGMFILEKAIDFVAITQCPYGCLYINKYDENSLCG